MSLAAFAIACMTQAPNYDADRLARVVPRLVEMTHRGALAGSVVLVRQRGKTLLSRSIGYADLEAKKLMSSDTVFQVMSMTKPVTAMAVMLCVEDGLLNLDDPVSKYLPSMKGVTVRGFEAKPAPTVLNLLTHTSGLASDDPGGLSDEAKWKMTLADYSKLIGTEPLLYQPGSEIKYSGVGISAAAAVVEKVSGKPFHEFVQKRIFDKLGMADTHFFLPDAKRARLAQVYGGEPGSLKVFAHDRFRTGAVFANGAGGLYSTASDMAKFIESFVGKSLLSPAGTRLMTSLQTGDLLMDNGRERGVGIGWIVTRRSPVGTTLRPVGSFGHTGAFGTEYWADPRSGTVAVFMAQTFGLPEDARKSFDTMVAAACCRD